MRIVADIIEYTAQKMPKFNSISISGYHMQEAGATAGAGAGLHLADGVSTCARHAKGLDVDALRRASFFCAIGWTSSWKSPSCAPRAAVGAVMQAS